jgi:hypothetical protein
MATVRSPAAVTAGMTAIVTHYNDKIRCSKAVGDVEPVTFLENLRRTRIAPVEYGVSATQNASYSHRVMRWHRIS